MTKNSKKIFKQFFKNKKKSEKNFQAIFHKKNTKIILLVSFYEKEKIQGSFHDKKILINFLDNFS